MSLAKLVYWLMAYTVGYWLSVRPQLSRGRLVLFDRYLLDALADPRRYRYGVGTRRAGASSGHQRQSYRDARRLCSVEPSSSEGCDRRV